MTDKQIIEEDMVNAKDFCPYYPCEVDCYGARMCQWFVDTLQQLKRKEQEYEQLRETMRKDFCSYYVLGECSQNHHNNCVGRKQCIKDLEQECEKIKQDNSTLFDKAIETRKENITLQEQLHQLKQAEQKLEKIKQYVKDNEWCLLDETYKELLQIIEE